MNAILNKIFINRTIVLKSLVNYGFESLDGEFFYRTLICDGKMELRVFVSDNLAIKTDVIDLETQEPYSLFLVEEAVGSFVGMVRKDYEKVLSDIADKCCEREVFKSDYAKRIIKYVRGNFGGELEFLWEKFSQNAIWRRKDNRKWYALLLTVSKRKLGIDSDEIIEIIDLRAKPNEAEKLVDNKKYFKGYHMNKKHWITICLDGSVGFDEICSRINESFLLAK